VEKRGERTGEFTWRERIGESRNRFLELARRFSMNKTISLLYKGVKNPSKVLRYGLHVFSVARNKVTRTLSARARASEEGERLVIKDVQSVRNSTDFVILAHIQRYEWITPYVKNLRCLDVGCGSGYGTHYLAENGVRMITGIDLSGSGINYANKHYKRENIDFIQMDACNLEFQDNSFDAVICFDVLEHLNEEDQIRLVSEAARVLSEHGAIRGITRNMGRRTPPGTVRYPFIPTNRK